MISENSEQVMDSTIMDILEKKKNIKMAIRRTQSCNYDIHIPTNPELEKRRASALVDELLLDIYNTVHNGTTDYFSTSGKSQKSFCINLIDLQDKDAGELLEIVQYLREHVAHTGSVLVRQLKRRDSLRRQQQAHCDVISRILSHRASDDMRFTIQPSILEGLAFTKWSAAMKMVAQLPGGIPPEFRKQLWITMAERFLYSKKIDWPQVEKMCFSEWSNPADAELGIQIVKDLHRTGCNLFCGDDSHHNQALLKKVLLGYARWNKAVGYCQGFNMLAALILQVTDKCESDALKLMIYLIEGILPDSYFVENLRGLSVDMAVFRELLRSKLPRLSKHLDELQNDGIISYEPPLTNVFTMQWFLTIFCNCIPHSAVLRVWDLILIEGNEFLLRTALAIWHVLAQRILLAKTATDFYDLVGALISERLESMLVDSDNLVEAIIAIGPLVELKSLREHYLYNIRPWGTSVSPHTVNKINVYPKEDHSKILLDISALEKQYDKLKQRQRQTHIIISAAVNIQSPPSITPVAMNHLLVGKSALGPSRRTGPLKGSIPPARHKQVLQQRTIRWNQVAIPKNSVFVQTLETTPCSSSSSSDTELCDDENIEVQSQISNKEPEAGVEDSILSQIDINKPSDNNDTDFIPDSSIIVNNESLTSSLHNNLKVLTDSEDEDKNDAEFEKFLIDRLKCDQTTKKDSELTLQIIQENSQILQRIMECQSRFSSLSSNAMESQFSEENDFHLNESKMDFRKVDSWLECMNLEEICSKEINNFLMGSLDRDQPETPCPNQIPNFDIKYLEIEERSNIDSPCKNYPNISKNEDSASSLQDFSISTRDSIGLNDNENFVNAASASQEDSNSHSCDNFRTDFIRSKSCFSLDSKIPNNEKTQISLPDIYSDVVFNPFPVKRKLNPNKEVTLKLGLYK